MYLGHAPCREGGSITSQYDCPIVLIWLRVIYLKRLLVTASAYTLAFSVVVSKLGHGFLGVQGRGVVGIRCVWIFRAWRHSECFGG